MRRSGTRRWRRVPALLQVETVDCAAACLAMVLRAHGRWDVPQTVREACGASGQGTSAAALVEAAASFGLDARAYRCEPDDLARRPMPQILHWDDGHFVVLERMVAGGAVVCDPAHGRLRLDAAAFARRFRGVTITLVPGVAFTRTRRPPGLVRRLLPFLRGSLAEMGQLAFVAVAMAGLAILVPGFTRIYIDEYLVQDRSDWLIPLIGCMLAVALLQAGLAWLHGRGLLLLQTKITATVSAAVTWRLLRLPDGFFRRRGAVDVATRGALAGQVAGLIAGPFSGAITAGLSLVVYGLVMLAYSVELTAIVLTLSLINLAVLWRLAGSMHEASCRVQMAASEAHAALVQGIAVLEQARADAAEGALFERLMRTQLDQLNAEQASGLNGALTGAAPFLLNRLLTIAVLGAGSLLVLWTDFTVGALMGFVMLADLFATTLATLAAIGPSAAGASSALVRLDDLLDPPLPAWTAAAGDASGGLSLSGVSFAEGARPPILSGIDLAVRPGQVVGIAGPAGSGKTLLGGIIAGAVAPNTGAVRFELRGGGSAEAGTCRGVALVETAPFLPAGTLRAALTLWAPDVTAEAVERALADADLLDLVRQRPGGIAGPVAEGGLNFSGGERQRLGLARALLQSPSVLVLDDATSALDESTEGRILAALRRRGLTLVLLTNRESALALCDTTLRLTDGRVAPLRVGAERARAA